MRSRFYLSNGFNHSLIALGYMLEEFCERQHCDQYVHSVEGSFPQCLMVQRELSRVGNCPLRYDKIVVKAISEEKAVHASEVKGKLTRKKGFTPRSK